MPTGEAASASAAGRMLREARLAQNLDIDALASLIKVTPAKLEALESGRHEQLPDANFTRALAMTVCRSLKIDPAPVLAGLPAAHAMPLAPHKPALNQPFKESRGAKLSFDSGRSLEFRSLLKPQWLAPILLLVASAVVYFLPDSIQWPHRLAPVGKPAADARPTPVASQPSAAASAALDVANAPEIAPSEALISSAASASSGAVNLASAEAQAVPSPQLTSASSVDLKSAPSALVLTSREPAWVEVRDQQGKLLSRLLKEGERVELEGTPPFKLRLGNATALDLAYQGQPVELAPFTRNRVARLELK